MAEHPVKLDELLSKYEYAPHDSSPVEVNLVFNLERFRKGKFWWANDTHGRFVIINSKCASEWLARTNPETNPSIDIALAE